MITRKPYSTRLPVGLIDRVKVASQAHGYSVTTIIELAIVEKLQALSEPTQPADG